MRSKISESQHQDMIERCRRMTPEERLNAFLNHSQLMMQIHQAGNDFRAHSPNASKKGNS